MNATLRDALAYATQGLRVFPVHATDDSGACSCGTPGCDSAGKHPRTRNGLKDATIAEAIVRGWFGGAPRANIAISTGASDLVVIDIDVKHGQPGLENWGLLVSLFRNEYGIDLEDTCVVVTPSGGCHYYYRAAGQRVACSAGKLAAGIDVRGDGGYVVAPPSRIAGIAYSFVEDHGLDHVRDLPKALAERLTDIAPITDDRGPRPVKWCTSKTVGPSSPS